MPVLRTCLVCSATFTTHQSEIRRGDGKYCSRKCYQQERLGPLPDRFWSLVLKTAGDECWLWQGSRSTKGYGQFSIHNKRYQAHRIAYELIFGMILPGIFCCHHCDNPLCCRPDHLFIGSASDNVQDMVRKGRTWAQVHPERVKRGRDHHTKLHPETVRRGTEISQAKVTEDEVREIRRLRDVEKRKLKCLAAHFGLSIATVGKICNRQAWKHVD